jgi:hypothetical protein
MDLSAMTKDQLQDEVTTWAGRVAAGEARLLELIGELDAREAWAGWGVLSCAHWLSYRCGMGLATARERVRVARALRELPQTRELFGAGRLSWSQVRALTRVATPGNEQQLVEIARHSTGAQIEKVARGLRRAQQAEADAKDPEDAAYRMRTRIRYDEDGTVVLTMRMTAEQSQVVLAVLEQTRAVLETADAPAEAPGTDAAAHLSAFEAPQDVSAETSATILQLPTPRLPVDPAAPSRPRPTLGDALVHLCATASHVTVGAKVRHRLKACIDPLSGWARLADGELLPPGRLTATQIPPALRAQGPSREELFALLSPDALAVHDVGRDQREAPPALRALLGQVDGERCRFPGCDRTRFLHAHHVVFWSEGGCTVLSNLVLLCGKHHRYVHHEGVQLTLHPDRRLEVRDSSMRIIDMRVLAAFGDPLTLDRGELTATTLPPAWDGSRLDLDHVVWTLMQQAA